ncbi:MAG: hypothetical protein EBS01_00470 [Verrucomicrobia bacterium]|nr:hypothetical protein [Verrucomicrobiota bacterium]
MVQLFCCGFTHSIKEVDHSWRATKTDKGMKFSSLSFHSLRHTRNSVMHAKGVSQENGCGSPAIPRPA